MRKFHTTTPWFGEAVATLCEQTSVDSPVPGQQIVLSGGRAVEILSVTPPKFHRDGYLGRHYWTVEITLRLLP